MRRRAFPALLGGTALAWPRTPRGQPAGQRPTVGLVLGGPPLADMAGPDPAFLPARAFVHRLHALGWIDGRTIAIERRSAEGQPGRAAAIVGELVARGVDVIMVGSSDFLRDATLQATRTIPVVALFPEDPVVEGLVPSLARPGGNLTGVATTAGRDVDEKRLQLLKELTPRVARVAFIGRRRAWEAYRNGADAAMVPHVLAPVERPEDYDEAFAIVRRERADALLVSHGPVMFFGVPRVVAFAAEQRLPAVYPWREAIEAGGLMSYGTNVHGLFRQAAGLVDRILKGARAADLPIEQPTTFELAINIRTAAELGLSPPPALLARADEVIE
jgi:putative ABC transport system substrate-binding protein